MTLTQESQNQQIDLLSGPGDSAPLEKASTMPAQNPDAKAKPQDPNKEGEVKEGGEAPEVEVKTDPEDKTSTDSYSTKFAALARKEKSIREEKQKLKAAWDEVNQFKTLRDSARDNPEEYLKAAGLDYEYLTNYLMSDKQVPPEEKIARVGSEVERLKQQLAEKERNVEIERLKNVVASFKTKMKDTAVSKKDDFEVLNAIDDGIELAYQEMDRVYRDEERELSIEEGLALAEKKVSDQIEKDLERLSKVKKFSKWFRPQEGLKEETTKAAGNQAKTLTNQPVLKPIPKQGNGRLTDEQRFQYAASLLTRS